MAMRLLSFVIWAVVAASAVFWLTRLLSRADPPPPHTVVAQAGASVAAADFSRLLGSTRVVAAGPASAEPEPPADARFKLIGVVAPQADASDSGLALIAIDGKPPRPIALGGVVDGPLVLLAVNHRRADLGPAGGTATVRLELPMVPEANRSARGPGAAVTTPVIPQRQSPPFPQPVNTPGQAPTDARQGQGGQQAPLMPQRRPLPSAAR